MGPVLSGLGGRGNRAGADPGSSIKGFHVGDARVKKLTPASKMCDRSDAAQPRVTNVKTPFVSLLFWAAEGRI